MFNNGTSPSCYQLNPSCLRCNNYGNADYDIRNYFSASYVWQTPWKFGNKFVNGAFGGWTLSQNFFARTGLPFTVLDGNDGIGNYDAEATRCRHYPAQVVQRWTRAAATSTGLRLPEPVTTSTTGAATTFPNQIRNQYRGPGFFDSDFSVNKNFKLTERMAFGVGANFYNVFNHPNFDLPGQLRFGDAAPSVKILRPRLRLPDRTDRSSPVCLRDASSSSRARSCSKRSEMLRLGGSFGSRRFFCNRHTHKSSFASSNRPSLLLVHFKLR